MSDGLVERDHIARPYCVVYVTVDYAWEKTYQAVSSLAGRGPLRSRLEDAYILLIRITPLNDLPVTLRDDYAEILRPVDEATAEADEGKIRAALVAMSDADQERTAERIVSLFASLAARDYEPHADDPPWGLTLEFRAD